MEAVPTEATVTPAPTEIPEETSAGLYEESKDLSEKVLDELVAATGGKREYVWKTDTMSGIN